MHILENIYQLAGDSFGTICNMFVIKGDGGMVLIEAGAEACLEVAKETLKEWNLQDIPITHVVATHSHYDHTVNCYKFREMGAKIIALAGDADALENGDDRIIDYGAFRASSPFKTCPVDIRPKDGDVIEVHGIRLEFLHFPGHTDGSHFVRYITNDGRIVLFTGDIQRVGMDGDFRSARLAWSGGTDYNREVFMESLKRIKDLDADVLLPSHGEKTLREGWKVLKGMYLRALLDWRPRARFDEFKYD